MAPATSNIRNKLDRLWLCATLIAFSHLMVPSIFVAAKTHRGQATSRKTAIHTQRILKGKGDKQSNAPPPTSPAPTSSVSPTFPPTTYPSAVPTVAPSSEPSSSMPPTAYIWAIAEETDGSLTSSCQETPPDTLLQASFVTQIEYSYYLYLPEVDLETAVIEATGMESTIHSALTKNALSCDYTNSDLVVLQLSSPPDGVVVFGECTDVVTNGTCWSVLSKANATVYSMVTNAALLESFTSWIQDALSSAVDGITILGAELQGFSNQDLGSGTELAGTDVTSPTETQTSALNQSNIPDDSSSRPLGPFVVAVAAVAFIVVSVFLVRRRKQRQKAYLECFENVNKLALDPEFVEQSNQHAEFVNDDDLYSVNNFNVVETDMDAQHNPRTCVVSNCPECHRQYQPTFISAAKNKH